MILQYSYWIAGVILALAWFSRILQAAIGMPQVADVARPEWDRKPPTPNGEPRVSIIVPARNEEIDIRATLESLLAVDYSNYEIIAVNDRSTDRTGEIMDDVLASSCSAGAPARVASSESTASPANKIVGSRLRIIHVEELPSGWMGKTHAMWTAGKQATGDWLLFTDADVIFKPDALRRVIAYADAENADHVVLFPRMIMKHAGERMMIAFFQALFVFGHRPWKVADPNAQDHMGVGAFNMVRRPVYDAIGTYQALRMEVLDDMKLGKVIKNAGYAQRNVFGEDLISLHWVRGTFGIVENLTKNFFALLSFQWPRTVASIVALAFLNLGPFVGIWLTHGWARLPYAVALASLFGIYYGMARLSDVAPYYVLLHPISTCLVTYTVARSMVLTIRQGGVVWRGTKYPLEELRRGMV
ncbi:MAG TPA: glycosyltransferase family 2 protein [Terriglobales bacterium]|nr:glycosyltransferase family 2 protein [Terriglobales bacterium]